MATEIIISESYQVNDGISTLVNTTTVEVNVPSTADLIAEKEAKLLKIYEELQALKEK